MIEKEIAEKVKLLPDDKKRQVLDYVEFLLLKSRGFKKLKYAWEGALEELKGKYTSVELQHKASEWR